MSKKSQITEVLEDVCDIIENAADLSTDSVQSITDTAILTTNLYSNIISGIFEYAKEFPYSQRSINEKLMNCTNINDAFSLHHNLIDTNYNMCHKLGSNCGCHINNFTKNMCDIMSYYSQNNWFNKLKNKKKHR